MNAVAWLAVPAKLLAALDGAHTRLVQVAMLDDGKNGPAVLKGLSVHSVTCCDEALALLERGTDRRQTASTLLNSSSSRSHAGAIPAQQMPGVAPSCGTAIRGLLLQGPCLLCNPPAPAPHPPPPVFIVTIQTSELNPAGQVVQRHGKLHMVDLAGSESAGRWAGQKPAVRASLLALLQGNWAP